MRLLGAVALVSLASAIGCSHDDAGVAAAPVSPGGDAGASTPDADAGSAARTCGPDEPAAAPFDPASLAPNAVDVVHAWRFATDPSGIGATSGWAAPTFDDSAWTTIDAGRSWESQGVTYDGAAWYRRHVNVPASWKGDGVRLVAEGVDDEYDVFVNGTLLGHHGSKDYSVWNRQTETELSSALVTGDNVLAVRVIDDGGGGGLVRKILVRHDPPLASYQALLPEPILPAHADWVDLYWLAWSLAFRKISFGTPDNGFSPAYMDEGFNEQVFQWDSSFMSLFARYGSRLFPAMGALDNFYGKQRPDGYIQRVYSETDGHELADPTPDEPMVNPPLFAWVEWEYFRFTGDDSRLARVYPVLSKYWHWLQNNVRAPEGRGLLYQTDLGSGMDNTPRGDLGHGGWVDMSAEQALAAGALARIADRLGLASEKAAWQSEHDALAAAIEKELWDEQDGTYYDLLRSGTRAKVKHIGAFWTLLAGVATGAHASRLVAHLRDPREFARPHPFPSLAASEPTYVARGNYWRGSVWAPTNYMVARGLSLVGETDLARDAAEKHIAAMAAVVAKPPTDASLIAPDERDGDYRTIWECYSPEALTPATRWDDTFYSRQDFVGWSGLGPIAMLFEAVIGLEVLGSEGRIVWSLSRTDELGARRMPLGRGHTVDLVAHARASADAPVTIDVRSSRAFTLEVRVAGKAPFVASVCPGASTVTVP